MGTVESTFGRIASAAGSFLKNPVVSTAGTIIQGIEGLREFSRGQETAASGQDAINFGNEFGGNEPQINIARGQESDRSGSQGSIVDYLNSQGRPFLGKQQMQTPTSQANILAPLSQIGSRLIQQIPRQLPNIAVGTGAGLATQAFMPSSANTTPFNRITRKLRSQIRALYNMSMMDLNATASLASSIFGVRMTGEDIAFILMKRFRNDGALVTKAAMRKTRKTLNSLKRADDLLKMARPRPRADVAA